MTMVIESKRLILKPVHADDIGAIYQLRSDPEVMKWVGDGHLWSKDEVIDWVALAASYYKRYGLDFFSAFEKATDQFIGQAGLFHLGFDTEQDEIELAYRFHKDAWGKGYATEASLALIDYGFNTLGLSKIIATHYPANHASKRVLEKLGFIYTDDRLYKNHALPFYTRWPNDNKSQGDGDANGAQQGHGAYKVHNGESDNNAGHKPQGQ